MSEINRIRELGIRLSDLPEYVISRMYGHLVKYDKDNEGDEDTCPRGGRHLEYGRKFVVDCYEVTFLSRLPEEQRNRVVRSTARSDYVTVGKNRDGIQDYDIVRQERRL